MKHLRKFIFIIAFLSSGIISGQALADNTSEVLEKLFNRLLSCYEDSDRITINDSIAEIIDTYVRSDSVFHHRFNNLKYLGQITSPDSLLKIVTWNLVLGSGQSRYFCYLIKKTNSNKFNLIYRLSTLYKEDQIKIDKTYCEHDWYGALYYDIRPVEIDNKRVWTLLGIDYGNPNISRKMIDVLCFTEKDSVVFGRKCFVFDDTVKFRDVFGYASNGMMSLKFSSDSSIVFDHLVPFAPELKDDRQYYGPDYSYDGYYFKDGMWKFKINVDARNKE